MAGEVLQRVHIAGQEDAQEAEVAEDVLVAREHGPDEEVLEPVEAEHAGKAGKDGERPVDP